LQKAGFAENEAGLDGSGGTGMNSRIDLTTLGLFITVAELRSITKTAEREHIAASAVSKRLSDLETELRAKLFHRLPRGLELTAAGFALLHHASAILRRLDELEADLSEYAEGT
jgi:DNA-binding transcriptional LysR family regulator